MRGVRDERRGCEEMRGGAGRDERRDLRDEMRGCEG